MGGVAVQHWCVSVGDLARVVQDDDLSREGGASLRGVVLGVTAHVSTADILDGDVLDVEANVVAGNSLLKLLVVHLNGLDFSADVAGGKGDNHAGLQNTSLNTSDGDCADTSNLVHVLQGKTQGLGGRARRGDNGIEGLKEGLASQSLLIASLGAADLLGPSLVPGQL